MKLNVERPERLVDITHLPGSTASRSTATAAPHRRAGQDEQRSPTSRHHGAAPASRKRSGRPPRPQLRNMATIGGNLMQRTRCVYFRDPAPIPLQQAHARLRLRRDRRRQPQPRRAGHQRRCIATYPGDFAVALVAFDADHRIRRRASDAVDDFFLLPGDDAGSRDTLSSPAR